MHVAACNSDMLLPDDLTESLKVLSLIFALTTLLQMAQMVLDPSYLNNDNDNNNVTIKIALPPPVAR